jgi:Fe-S cluster biogenesis protein NfuA
VVKINAEPSMADPHVCRFTLDRVVHPGGPYTYNDAAKAEGSPLPERLFGIEGVSSVVVAENVVTIRQVGQIDWSDLAPKVGQAIREELQGGGEQIAAGTAPGQRSDEEIREVVQELFERRINPGLAGHGGFIQLVDVRDRVVSVRMGGGCQGCHAAAMTLDSGVEAIIRSEVPEIEKIVDVTDHGAGQNPFYTVGGS